MNTPSRHIAEKDSLSIFRREIIGVLFLLLLPFLYGIQLLIRCFLFDYFIIPTESMYPTLQSGDKVVVNKLVMGARVYKEFHFSPDGQDLQSLRTKGLRSLRHNDIVVFNFPHHGWKINFVINNVFCKRIMALPGDSLSIVNGHYRNNNYEGVLGLEMEQKRLENTPDSLVWPPSLTCIPFEEHFDWTIRNFGPMYIPRKGDVMRVTPKEARLYQLLLEWELGKKVEYDWEQGVAFADDRPLTRHQWQHNYYFMAGDNVLDSNDSRYWGLVPEEYIVGVVQYIHKNRRR